MGDWVSRARKGACTALFSLLAGASLGPGDRWPCGGGEVVDRTFTDETGYFLVESETPGSFFLGAEDLEERVAIWTSDYLRMIPRVRIREGFLGGRTVTISGAGVSSWLTGGRGNPRVLGIEVYRGPSETPLQYGGSTSSCGVILNWTR